MHGEIVFMWMMPVDEIFTTSYTMMNMTPLNKHEVKGAASHTFEEEITCKI